MLLKETDLAAVVENLGTDDDLPLSHHNMSTRARDPGNGRPIVDAASYLRVEDDIATQIRRFEREAYSSVLRAFKAQSDIINWEQEGLISVLRKELGVTSQEHAEFLSRINSDDIIRRIREWRRTGGIQTGVVNYSRPTHDAIPSPTVPASYKRRRKSQPIPSLSFAVPSPTMRLQHVASSMKPSLSGARKGAPPGSREKKPRSDQTLPGASSMKSMQYPSACPSRRWGPVPNMNSAIEPAKRLQHHRLIGCKVMTRWPDDNKFYEAIITNYNPVEGLHALVYDINTKNETVEWVNLKEIYPEDIRWEGEEPGIDHWSCQGAPPRRVKMSTGRGGTINGARRGRRSFTNQFKKNFPPTQNGIGKKNVGDIEILHTDALLKEVLRVYGASHPDALEIEKAKKVLMEHEQSLINAISKLANASDSESEDDERQFSRVPSIDLDRGWKNQRYAGNQHG